MPRAAGARRGPTSASLAGGPLLALALTACSPPEPGTFSGVVTGPGGTVQSGCGLTVVAASDVDQPVPEYAAVSDGAGRYAYRLPPGTYEVTALCASGAASATARLDPGATTELDLAVD